MARAALLPFSVSARSLAVVTTVMFAFVIVGAYLNYGVFYAPWKPLPTISRTWTYEPFNFVSRVVVGWGCVLLALLHLVVYYATPTAAFSSSLLFIGVASSACLAVVAAVCTSADSPECLGNQRFHYGFAIAFFLLMDVFMAVIIVRDGVLPARARPRAPRGVCGALARVVDALAVAAVGLVLADACTDARGPRLSSLTLAQFEWLNVSVIFVFMTRIVATRAPDYGVGLQCSSPAAAAPDPKPAEKPRGSAAPAERPTTDDFSVDFSVSATSLASIVVVEAVLLVGIPYAVSVSRGDVDPLPYFPELSLLYVYAPGNYFGRLFGTQTALFLAVLLPLFWLSGGASGSLTGVAGPAGGSRGDRLPLLWGTITAGCVTAVALAASLSVSNVESNVIHAGFVAVLFTGGTALLALAALSDPRSVAFAVASVASKARFLLDPDSDAFNWLELADVAAGVAWIALFAWYHAAELAGAAFVVFRRDGESVGDPDASAPVL